MLFWYMIQYLSKNSERYKQNRYVNNYFGLHLLCTSHRCPNSYAQICTPWRLIICLKVVFPLLLVILIVARGWVFINLGEVATARASAASNVIMVPSCWMFESLSFISLNDDDILTHYYRGCPSCRHARWRKLLPAAVLFVSSNYTYIFEALVLSLTHYRIVGINFLKHKSRGHDIMI